MTGSNNIDINMILIAGILIIVYFYFKSNEKFKNLNKYSSNSNSKLDKPISTKNSKMKYPFNDTFSNFQPMNECKNCYEIDESYFL